MQIRQIQMRAHRSAFVKRPDIMMILKSVHSTTTTETNDGGYFRYQLNYVHDRRARLSYGLARARESSVTVNATMKKA